jgi:hypothetical protein
MLTIKEVFYKEGQSLEINDLGDFKNGYAFIKYKNITSEELAEVQEHL